MPSFQLMCLILALTIVLSSSKFSNLKRGISLLLPVREMVFSVRRSLRSKIEPFNEFSSVILQNLFFS